MTEHYLEDLRRSLAEELESSMWRDGKRLAEMNEWAKLSKVIRELREMFPYSEAAE